MILIAMGGNLPFNGLKVEQTFELALNAMRDQQITPYRLSRLYRTKPIGPVQPDYVNAVIAVQSPKTPVAVMRILHGIEYLFGRQRREAWGARTLDLDLLDWHGQVWNAPLQLPHPRAIQRAFVLLPMRDIAPGWVCPKTGAVLDDLIQGLDVSEKRAVLPLN